MRILAGIFLGLALLLAAVWWFLADEALEPETRKWLEEARNAQPSEGLDFLILMGLMAPADEDPIEHARELIRQMGEDVNLRVDYLEDLMRNSPCDIEDWACWENDSSPWVADTLESNAHVLERWRSLPVHHDFGRDPLGRVLTILMPAFEALRHLSALELVNATRAKSLNELASRAAVQSTSLAVARPTDGYLLSVATFELFRNNPVNQFLTAIRLGAAPLSAESIAETFSEPILVEELLTASSRREFGRLANMHLRFRQQFPDNLLARHNRTMNRARACLAEVVALSDQAVLFEFMEADAEICGPDWRSWRNWRGDKLIALLVLPRNDMACRLHAITHHDALAHATLQAVLHHESQEQRLAAIGRANPFYPDRGAFIKDDQICFEPLAPSCGNTCLAAPWDPIATPE